MAEKKNGQNGGSPKASKERGLSVDDLAERYDFAAKIAAMIRRTVRKIPAGKVWSDADMKIECGIGASGRVRMGEFREIAENDDEFLKYQFFIEGKGTFWAQPKTVVSACEAIGKAQPLGEGQP